VRLTELQKEAIQTTFLSVFEQGSLYVFGSRVFDHKKGGDIDLYLTPKTHIDLVEKKVKFLSRLKRLIGEQKIDLVLDYGESRPIDLKAKKEGVLLCQK
jgi:hypothetical protein